MVAYPEKTKTPYSQILLMFPHTVLTLPNGLVQSYSVLGTSDAAKWRAKRLAVVGGPRTHPIVRCSEYSQATDESCESWDTESLKKVGFSYGVMTMQDTKAWKSIREKFGFPDAVTSIWPTYLAPGYGPSVHNCHQVLIGYLYVDLGTNEIHLVGMDGGWDVQTSTVYQYVCGGSSNMVNGGRPNAWLMSLLMRGTPHSIQNKHSVGEPTIEGGHDKLLAKFLDGIGLQYLRNVENVNEILRGNPIAAYDMLETSQILQQAYVGPTIYMQGPDVPARIIRYQVQADIEKNTKITVKESKFVSDTPIDKDMKAALAQVFPLAGITF